MSAGLSCSQHWADDTMSGHRASRTSASRGTSSEPASPAGPCTAGRGRAVGWTQCGLEGRAAGLRRVRTSGLNGSRCPGDPGRPVHQQVDGHNGVASSEPPPASNRRTSTSAGGSQKSHAPHSHFDVSPRGPSSSWERALAALPASSERERRGGGAGPEGWVAREATCPDVARLRSAHPRRGRRLPARGACGLWPPGPGRGQRGRPLQAGLSPVATCRPGASAGSSQQHRETEVTGQRRPKSGPRRTPMAQPPAWDPPRRLGCLGGQMRHFCSEAGTDAPEVAPDGLVCGPTLDSGFTADISRRPSGRPGARPGPAGRGCGPWS